MIRCCKLGHSNLDKYVNDYDVNNGAVLIKTKHACKIAPLTNGELCCINYGSYLLTRESPLANQNAHDL